MMNPDDGTIRMLCDAFNEATARKAGYTTKFYVGEIIKIKDIYFKVLNFVEDLNTMNLKCMATEEALKEQRKERRNENY